MDWDVKEELDSFFLKYYFKMVEAKGGITWMWAEIISVQRVLAGKRDI